MRCKRAATGAALKQVESWNVAAKADADAYDLPQIWILVSPVEARAMADGAVGARLRKLAAKLSANDFQETR